MDASTVTVAELTDWLNRNAAPEARVVITPPSGPAFPLLGWTVSTDGTVLLIIEPEE